MLCRYDTRAAIKIDVIPEAQTIKLIKNTSEYNLIRINI